MKTTSSPNPFYVVKQEAGELFLFFLTLYDKSEEEVSSAGEQLTSNRIYDGENTIARGRLKRAPSLLFSVFIVKMAKKNLRFKFHHTFN
jgi:hypothetical protein